MSPGAWNLAGDTLTLSCHVQPNARHTRVVGMHGQRLKIQLNAPPVDGKANAMLIRFLARFFDRPRSQVIISSGENSRQKTIQIKGINAIPEIILEFARD